MVVALAAAFVGLKVSSTVLEFVQLMNKLPTSKLSALFGGGGKGGSTPNLNLGPTG